MEGCRGALVGPGAVDESHCATWLLEIVMLTSIIKLTFIQLLLLK